MFMIADFEFTIMERHIRMLLLNIRYNTFNSTFYMWREPNMKKDPWEGGGGGFIFTNLGTSIPICDTVFYRLFYLLTLGDFELQTNNYCK